MENSRRLAAIMFTDIEGYTALMQSSEGAAIQVRNRHREVFEKQTEHYHGQIIQYYGDGTLSIFDSAVNAVLCAIELQKGFSSQASIPVRIGIHMGDILIGQEDIIGDAVNVASRVESLAISGSVLVSGSLVDQLKNHPQIGLASMGEFHFKNDAKPREIFALVDPALVLPKRSQLKGKTKEKKNLVARSMIGYVGISWLVLQLFQFLIQKNNLDIGYIDLFIIFLSFGFVAFLIFQWLREQSKWKIWLSQGLNAVFAICFMGAFVLNPNLVEFSQSRILNPFGNHKTIQDESLKSLAVLPIVNLTGDTSLQYLYQGMHFGLIGEISQLNNIRVPSQTTTIAYANTHKNIEQIAKELAVEAILETSLTRVDSLVHLRLNLIKVFPQEETLWTHSFSTLMGNMPNIYKEITQNTVAKIGAVVRPEQQKIFEPVRVPNPGAYEAYLKGKYYAGFLTAGSFTLAESYFKKAIEIDPGFSLGHSGLGLVWTSRKQMGLVSGEEANPNIRKYQAIGMKLDSLNPENWVGVGAIATWTDFDWKKGETGFLRSIEMNPNQAEARVTYAHLLLILNRREEAREQMAVAEEIDFLNPWVLAFSGALNIYDGRVLTGTRRFEKLRALEPDHPMLNRYLLSKNAATFQYDQAIEALKKLVKPMHEDLITFIDNSYEETDFKATIRSTAEELEKKEQKEFVSPNLIYMLYDVLEDKEKRIFWLQKMHEYRDPNLPYYAIRTGESIQNDPRYIQIMEEIGLW